MRTTIVSTSKLKIYKSILVAIVTVYVLGASVYYIHSINTTQDYFLLLNFPLFILFIYLLTRHIKKIKSISFDESSVYYVKNDYEVQVPFEEIKSIDIKSLDGVYEIKFYTPVQDGDKIFFKTSLWYPFNFKKKDAEVNILRDKIDRYKSTLPERHLTELPGYRI